MDVDVVFVLFIITTQPASPVNPLKYNNKHHLAGPTAISCALQCVSQTACSRFSLTPKTRCLLDGDRSSRQISGEVSYMVVNYREAAKRPIRPSFIGMYFQIGINVRSTDEARSNSIGCPYSFILYSHVIELDKLIYDIVPDLYYNLATQKTVDIVKGQLKNDLTLFDTSTCRLHVISNSKSMYFSKCIDGSNHILHQYFRFKLNARMFSLDKKAHLLFILTKKEKIYCLVQGRNGYTYFVNLGANGMGVDSHNSKLYVKFHGLVSEQVSVFQYDGCEKLTVTRLELKPNAERLVLNPVGDKLYYCEDNYLKVYLPQEVRSLGHQLTGRCLRVASVGEEVLVSHHGNKNITVFRFQANSFAVVRHLHY